MSEEKKQYRSILMATARGFYLGAQFSVLPAGILAVVGVCAVLMLSLDVPEVREDWLAGVLTWAYLAALMTLLSAIVSALGAGLYAAIKRLRR